MILKHAWLLAILVIIPNIGGWIGALTFDLDWYNSLNKASINPPGWLFAPMWTVLYCLMGVASFLVWTKEEADAVAPLLLYVIQLVLNWAWTPLFFHYHEILWALIEIVSNDVVVVLTIIAFYRVRALAGILLLPYIVWLCIATYLNLYIYQHN